MNLFSGNTKKGSSELSTTSSTRPPLLGTSSIIVELQRDAERATEGKNLIVAEWGERRIIRVEGETGARTPLVTMLPVSTESNNELRRVFRPNHLMYTPFGDLLFSDSYESGSEGEKKSMAAVYRLREAVHVHAIPVEQSRDAHAWTGTTADGSLTNDSVDVVFETEGWIDGMALGGVDHSTLFVSVVTHSGDESGSGWTKTLYKLSLHADDEEDDDDDGTQQASNAKDEAAVASHEKLFSISSRECLDFQVDREDNSSSDFAGSKLAIDNRGTVYMVACPSSLLLLSSNDGHVIGKLTLDPLQPQATPSTQSSAISSVNFGEDGYIYLTRFESLMRIKSRIKGHSIPTNMVVPPSSKSTRRDKRDKQ